LGNSGQFWVILTILTSLGLYGKKHTRIAYQNMAKYGKIWKNSPFCQNSRFSKNGHFWQNLRHPQKKGEKTGFLDIFAVFLKRFFCY